jgi:hypothetical protein
MTGFTCHHHRQGLFRNPGQGRGFPRPRVADNLLWEHHGGPEHRRGAFALPGIAAFAAMPESPVGLPVTHRGSLTDSTPVQNAPSFADSPKDR